MHTAEEAARRFHEVYETLAPSFGWKTQKQSAVAWEDVPDENRKLMIAVIRVLLPEIPEGRSGQGIESDRNHWQGRVGVLLGLIETLGPPEMNAAAIRMVNTNRFTGSVSTEPYADIASLTHANHLKMALATGSVVPGPNAPPWMTNTEEE